MRRPVLLTAAVLLALIAPAGSSTAEAPAASRQPGGTRPTLSVAPVVPVGDSVALVGRVPGARSVRRVVLQHREGGDWSTVARTRTSARGTFGVRLAPPDERVHRYRAVVRRGADGPRERTRPVVTRVAPRVEELTAGLEASDAYGHHAHLDVSADGRFVSFDSRGDGTDVFVWDRTLRRLGVISPRDSEQTFGGSLSGDGALAAVTTYNSTIRPDQPGRTDYPFQGIIDLRSGLFAPLLGGTRGVRESTGVELSDDATRLLSMSPGGSFSLTQIVRGRTWSVADRATDERAEQPVLASGGRHVTWVQAGQDAVTSERRGRLMLWEQGVGRRELAVPGYTTLRPLGLSGDGMFVLVGVPRPGTEGPAAVTDLLLVSADSGVVRNLTGDLPRGARGGVLTDDGALVHLGTEAGALVYDTATGSRVPARPSPPFLGELDTASRDGSVLVHVDGPTITTYMPVPAE